ncbi:MAG TPA: hypothetical protein VGK67_36380 [Myxococcales bacterium]|jgi:hypothetical protein
MKTSTLATLTKSALVLAVVALSACGGDPAEEFVGVWSESGTMTMNVGGQTLTGPQQMTTHIDLGLTAGEIFISGGCSVTAKVKGDTASIPNGASCTQNGNGASLTTTFRSATYTLNGDSITVYASGDVLYVINGQSVPGTFNYNAMLVKVAK